MIDALFSLLLVPFIPALEDPSVTHAATLNALEQRLNQSRNTPLANPDAETVSSSLLVDTPERLPLITGRVFEWSSSAVASEQAQVDEIGRTVEALRLTGVIESSGQRVAILNDGHTDHVVGVGSYVLNAYRVSSLDSGNVVLMPVAGWAKGKRLELKLMPGSTPGGL